jgi:glycosyltransferase involved in cell wall biosynthesis
MKKIVFFYPSNKRSVQIESTLVELKRLGHEILFLTTGNHGVLQDELERVGIKTYMTNVRSKNSFTYYIKNIFYLANFTRKHKVDIIFGNLQHANFIAVFTQFLTPSKLIAFRHHFKYNKGDFGIPLKVNQNEILFDKVINRLAKCIVVPSSGVYNGMIEFEKVDKNKVHIIPYIYEFSKYTEPSDSSVQKIKDQYPAELRVIMVARLIPFKRHILIFPIFKKLIEEGYDLKVLILDEGPEKENLENFIKNNSLQNHMFMVGFTTDFLAFMKACDILIHPSITEASNSVVKEIGLQQTPVAVCKGVGDFDEYIVDGQNGFVLDISNPQRDVENILKAIYKNSQLLEKMGIDLKSTVLKKFTNTTPIVEQYTELIDKL